MSDNIFILWIAGNPTYIFDKKPNPQCLKNLGFKPKQIDIILNNLDKGTNSYCPYYCLESRTIIKVVEVN